jgi:hypothetical protein
MYNPSQAVKPPPAETQDSLAQRWATLEALKSSIHSRCEEYAGWTLPYIFTQQTQTENTELQGPLDSIGARCVNHLANKLVSTLFTPYRSFFRISVTREAQAQLEFQLGDRQLKQAAMVEIEAGSAQAEKDAMMLSDNLGFRNSATMAAKSLVVTGNGLMYLPEDGSNVQTYNFRDYCVVRDIDGAPIEIMTRDTKAYETFSDTVQSAINDHKGPGKKCKPGDNITVYTQVLLKEDKRYHVKQAAEMIPLDSKASYPARLLPWIPLTWNRVRGENYGRGIVEDYAGAFHAVNMLTQALVSGAAIGSEIKFLVKPSSVLDVAELNGSKNGSYHQGEEGDITSPQLNKGNDFQLAQFLLERLERQISQAFLLGSAGQRDAERVTAVEIQRDALELEQSLGGVYSHLAQQWQRRYASLLLDRIDFRTDEAFVVQIITGMDSLSRMGELDNLQMFLMDLGMLNNIPEDVRAEISLSRMMKVIGTARSVQYEAFTKTPEEKQAEAAQQMQMNQQMVQQQANADLGVAAGKEAVKQQ